MDNIFEGYDSYGGGGGDYHPNNISKNMGYFRRLIRQEEEWAKAKIIIEKFIEENIKENLEDLLKSLGETRKINPDDIICKYPSYIIPNMENKLKPLKEEKFILALQTYLSKFEKEYGITTTEFLKNPSIITDKTDRTFWKFCSFYHNFYKEIQNL